MMVEKKQTIIDKLISVKSGPAVLTNLKQADLQAFVEAVSQTYFGRPFYHQAVYNSRLRTTGGRYHLRDHHLDFNPKMAQLPDFVGIVKHELVHYHLHLSKQGYRHQDADFKKLLAAVGGSRYAPALTGKSLRSDRWHYACQNGHDFYRQRRVNIQKYRCGQCRAKISLVGRLS